MAVAVVVVLLSLRNALAPPVAPTAPVVVAAHDLAAGRAIDVGDLRFVDWPAHLAPPVDAVSEPDELSGQVPATAIHAGEAITDARLVGPGLLTGQPAGTVAVPLRLADPAAAGVVSVGDHIDVIAGTGADPAFGGDTGPPRADVVASDVLVIAIPGRAGGASSGGFGALTSGSADADAAGMLVVAADRGDAVRLAGAQAAQALSVAVRAPSGVVDVSP